MNNWQYNDANFSGVIHKNNHNKQIKNIVLVGPHASGKTHNFNKLKQLLDNTKFSFPKRLTSRPVRLNDDNQENTFTDREKKLIRLNRSLAGSDQQQIPKTGVATETSPYRKARNVRHWPAKKRNPGITAFHHSESEITFPRQIPMLSQIIPSQRLP